MRELADEGCSDMSLLQAVADVVNKVPSLCLKFF